MNTSIVGLEVSLGQNDPGAPQNAKESCKVCYTYYLNKLANQNNRIRYEQLYKALRALQLFPSSLAEDLFLIACAVYAADIRINRYQHAQDSWTRQIKLFIPVSDLDKWESLTGTLASILGFLTGDIWHFDFRLRDNQNALFSDSRSKRYKGLSYKTDTVSLFSGGMDSFIGAFDLLKAGNEPLLVGHSKSADVSYFRNSAYNELKQKYNGNNLTLVQAYVSVDKQKNVTSREDTERGRSFLFLTLGALCASCLTIEDGQQRKLIVPENGMISINIALTPLRLGAYSTRTTHPHLLNLFQNLIDGLNFDVQIDNPYEFKTKGQMLVDTGDATFIASADTMSCSRPATRNAHLEGKGFKHCGRCVPCIIRRAALKRAGVADSQGNLPHEKKYRFDILTESVSASNIKGENIMAFKYFINQSEKHKSYVNSMIRMTGPLNNVEQYLDMYKESIEEVKSLIDPIKVTS